MSIKTAVFRVIVNSSGDIRKLPTVQFRLPTNVHLRNRNRLSRGSYDVGHGTSFNLNSSTMNDNSSNYEIFRDCLSSVIVERSNEQPRRPPKRKSYKARRNHTPANDNVTSSVPAPARTNPEDLAEFVDVYTLFQILLHSQYRQDTDTSMAVPGL